MFDTLIGLALNLGQRVLPQAVQFAKTTSAIPPGRMRETDEVKGPKCPLPAEPGVYRHIDRASGEVRYVGQTNNLRQRQQQHARAGKLDTASEYIQYGVAKPGATKDQLCGTERTHIGRHEPSGNTTQGGNGRR